MNKLIESQQNEVRFHKSTEKSASSPKPRASVVSESYQNLNDMPELNRPRVSVVSESYKNENRRKSKPKIMFAKEIKFTESEIQDSRNLHPAKRKSISEKRKSISEKRKSISEKRKSILQVEAPVKRRVSIVDPKEFLRRNSKGENLKRKSKSITKKKEDSKNKEDDKKDSVTEKQNKSTAQLHEDLISLKRRSIRRGGHITHVHENLFTLPEAFGGVKDAKTIDDIPLIINYNQEEDALTLRESQHKSRITNGRKRNISIFRKDSDTTLPTTTSTLNNEVGFLQAHVNEPRASVFYNEHLTEEDNLDESECLYRRNTMFNARTNFQSRGEKIKNIRQKMIKRKNTLRKSICAGLNNFDEDEKKKTFKSIVQAIIQAKRWNVPLYYGQADDPNHIMPEYSSPMDFDLASYTSKSWSNCTVSSKRLMCLEPWERSENDIDVIYQTVKRMSCFTKYNKAVKRELCRVVMYEKFEAGRIILQQGHHGVSMYFILTGSVSIQVTITDDKTGEKYQQIVSEIKAGNSFGELALVKDIRRTAAVICKTNSEFLRLDRQDFDAVLRRSMEIEWNERMNQLKQLPYFIDWPLGELKTINIRSKIVKFKTNSKVVGNVQGGQLPEKVYFIIKGRVNIVRKINVLCKTTTTGRYSKSKVRKQYKLVSYNSRNKRNLATILGSVKSGTSLDKPKLKEIERNEEKLKLTNEELKTQTLLQYTNGTTIKTELLEKYLVVGSLHAGDSFGFGEDLTNIFLIAACETEFLVIPGHVMVTAERHVECRIRDSSNRATSKFKSERHVDASSSKSNAFVQSLDVEKSHLKNDVSDSKRSVFTTKQSESEFHKEAKEKFQLIRDKNEKHHYEELKEMIEDKILSEEESFAKWRVFENWNAYKAATLDSVYRRF